MPHISKGSCPMQKVVSCQINSYFIPSRCSGSSTPNPCIADNFLYLTEDDRRCTTLYCNQSSKTKNTNSLTRLDNKLFYTYTLARMASGIFNAQDTSEALTLILFEQDGFRPTEIQL